MSKVSVVLPVFNGGKTLKETLKSILAQTFSDFEIIAVDDSSTDDSIKIIKETKDPRIKFFTLDKKNTGGPAAGRNKGIKESSGEFIALCDQDDAWLPEKLEKQIKAFENSNEKKKIGIIISSANLVDHNGNVIDKNLVPFEGFTRPKDAFEQLILGDFITACTAVVPKKIIDEVGMLDESLKGVDDYDLWLRITKKYGILGLSENLAIWKSTNQGLSKNKADHYLKNEKIFEKLETENSSEEIKFGHGKNLMRIFTSLVLQKKYQEAEKITEKIKNYPISSKAKIIVRLFKLSPGLAGFLLRLYDKMGQISL